MLASPRNIRSSRRCGRCRPLGAPRLAHAVVPVGAKRSTLIARPLQDGHALRSCPASNFRHGPIGAILRSACRRKGSSFGLSEQNLVHIWTSLAVQKSASFQFRNRDTKLVSCRMMRVGVCGDRERISKLATRVRGGAKRNGPADHRWAPTVDGGTSGSATPVHRAHRAPRCRRSQSPAELRSARKVTNSRVLSR